MYGGTPAMTDYHATTEATRTRQVRLGCPGDSSPRTRRFATACEVAEALHVEHSFSPSQIAAFIADFVGGRINDSAERLSAPKTKKAASASSFNATLTELIQAGQCPEAHCTMEQVVPELPGPRILGKSDFMIVPDPPAFLDADVSAAETGSGVSLRVVDYGDLERL